jgi:hypothetical protein
VKPPQTIVAVTAARTEARLFGGVFGDLRLAVLLALLAVCLTLAAQIPNTYRITIGQEDGVGGDLPLIADFNTAERDIHGPFRWTAGDSRVRLPGIGQRSIGLTIHTLPINDEMAAHGPQSFRIAAGGRDLGSAPIRPRGGIYYLRIPPPPGFWGDQEIAIRSSTIVPTGDLRELGVNVATIIVASDAGPSMPPIGSMLGWLATLVLAWATIRRIGYQPDSAQRMLLFAIPLIGLASVLDPPRLAFGAQPALVAIGLAWLLTIFLCRTGLVLPTRFSIPPSAWRALCLLAAITFALRYGGKIYPDSMPGDIGFHINRFADTLRGTVFILSKNRGVDFPYPPALYLTIAPLFLLIERGMALQLSAALLDAISPLLIYLIAMRSHLIRDWRFGVAAGALYALCGAGFMPTWWNFSTHIFAQFTHLLLICWVVLIWPWLQESGVRSQESEALPAPTASVRLKEDVSQTGADVPFPDRKSHESGVRSQESGVRSLDTRWRPLFAGLVCLQLLVYLGHFGFWVNTSLLGGLGLVVLAFAARRSGMGWSRWGLLAGAFVCAQVVALLFFYTGYTDLLRDQIGKAATGGLNQLAGRAPVSNVILWQTLRDGLYAHIGLLPIPLAITGLLLGKGQPSTRFLMLGTFLIGLAFAALPFLSGSTLATRWLMFSIWAIVVGSVACAERLWRSGWAGRLFTIVIGSYVLWISAALWLSALAWRVRPPEPF